MNGYEPHFKETNEQSIIDEISYKFCLNCSVKVEQSSIIRRKKYCSSKCKNEWRHTYRQVYIFHCEYCGKEYKSLGNKYRKYCSHD
jgi:endogenous inhibitor of DNA gyrase (YacG/DUF329 family)